MLPQAAPLLKRTNASIISSRDPGHWGHSYYGPPSHSHSFRQLPIPGLTTSLWGPCVNSPIAPRMTQTLLCTVWTQSSPQGGNGAPSCGSEETDSGPEVLRVRGRIARARKDHSSATLRGQPAVHFHRDPSWEGKEQQAALERLWPRGTFSTPTHCYRVRGHRRVWRRWCPPAAPAADEPQCQRRLGAAAPPTAERAGAARVGSSSSPSDS